MSTQNKKSLYDKSNYDNNYKKTEKDIFTGKHIQNMSTSEIKSSTMKYEKEIEKTQDNILITLRETKLLSNTIGNELNENTDSLNRINEGLDELEHKLNMSEYLVKRFSSWFSFFRPIKKMDPFVKHTNTKKFTKFEESDPELDTKSNIEKPDDFYDNVSVFLNSFQKDAETFGKILKEHSESIEIISDKTEKSDGRIKKSIEKVKNS